MKQEYFSVRIPFESIVEVVEVLDLNRLLSLRECVNSLITQRQAEYGKDELVSEVDIDYSLLQELLAAGDWEAADQETADLMLEAVDEDGGLLFVEKAENFPLNALNTINRLWVKYSNGRFGFSVQKRIWEQVGHNNEKFGELVGWYMQGRWIQDNNLKFTYDAPVGHLPFVRSGLCHVVERWSAEFFTDSEGEAQFVDSVDTVESIKMWKALVNLVIDIDNNRET